MALLVPFLDTLCAKSGCFVTKNITHLTKYDHFTYTKSHKIKFGQERDLHVAVSECEVAVLECEIAMTSANVTVL